MTYPCLHSAEYAYDIASDARGHTITLKQVSTGKVKQFFLAGERHVPNLVDHMNSLTDDLCSQWFNVREKKPKKEKTA